MLIATDVFKQRIRELRGNSSQKDIAAKLDISRASLGYYESGERKPDIEILGRIADLFGVSTDYLLGRTNVKTLNLEISQISNKYGLDENSLFKLEELKKVSENISSGYLDETPFLSRLCLNTVNSLFSSQFELLSELVNYLYLRFDKYYDDYTFNSEDLMGFVGDLGFLDSRLGVSFCPDDAENFITQSLILRLEKRIEKWREECQKSLPDRIIPKADEVGWQSDEIDEHLNKHDFQ